MTPGGPIAVARTFAPRTVTHCARVLVGVVVLRCSSRGVVTPLPDELFPATSEGREGSF